MKLEFDFQFDYLITAFSYAFNFDILWHLSMILAGNNWLYLILLVVFSLLIGAPFIHLQQSIGFVTKKGITGAMDTLMPLYKGITYAVWLLSIVFSVLIFRETSLSLYYLGYTAVNGLNYTRCGNYWNFQSVCVSPGSSADCQLELGLFSQYRMGKCEQKTDGSFTLDQLFNEDPPALPATIEFFRSHVLNIPKMSSEDLVALQTKGVPLEPFPMGFVLSLYPNVAVAVTALFVFVGISSGPKVFSKLAYVTLLVPIALLIALNVMLASVHDFNQPAIDLGSWMLRHYPGDIGTVVKMSVIGAASVLGVYAALSAANHKLTTPTFMTLNPHLIVLCLPLMAVLAWYPVLCVFQVHDQYRVNITAVTDIFPTLTSAMEQVLVPSAFSTFPLGIVYLVVFYSAVFLAQLGTLMPLIWTVCRHWTDKDSLRDHHWLVCLLVTVALALLTVCTNTATGQFIVYKLETGSLLTWFFASTIVTVQMNLKYGYCYVHANLSFVYVAHSPKGWHKFLMDVSLMLGLPLNQTYCEKYLQPRSGCVRDSELDSFQFCITKVMSSPQLSWYDKLIFMGIPIFLVLSFGLLRSLYFKIRSKPLKRLMNPSIDYIMQMRALFEKNVLEYEMSHVNRPSSANMHVLHDYTAPFHLTQQFGCLGTYIFGGYLVCIFELFVLFGLLGVFIFEYVTVKASDRVIATGLGVGTQLLTTAIALLLLFLSIYKRNSDLMTFYFMRSAAALGSSLALVQAAYQEDKYLSILLMCTLLVSCIRPVFVYILVGVHWTNRKSRAKEWDVMNDLMSTEYPVPLRPYMLDDDELRFIDEPVTPTPLMDTRQPEAWISWRVPRDETTQTFV